jgi:tripartite-type tricarboxylate transporter receptor subunit TctC
VTIIGTTRLPARAEKIDDQELGEETMKKLFATAAVAAALLCAPSALQAQTYPNRPITFIIGFAPGGPSDVMSRIIGRRMEQELKQPLIIENKTGAAGGVAAQFVSRAAPDGYTIMLGTNAALIIGPLVNKKLSYDATKDFDYVSMIGSQPDVLYVHPSVPVNNFAEYIAFAKANPGKLNFGSGGVGTPAHLSGEQLKIRAGIDIAHVPFRGTGPAMQTVITGHIQSAFSPTAPLIPHIQSGAVRPLAVTSPKRTGALPNLPTVAEGGFPGFDTKNWHCIALPPGTPKPIIEALNRALTNTLNDPAVKKQLSELGVDVTPSTPESFVNVFKEEIPMWADVIKKANVHVE